MYLSAKTRIKSLLTGVRYNDFHKLLTPMQILNYAGKQRSAKSAYRSAEWNSSHKTLHPTPSYEMQNGFDLPSAIERIIPTLTG